MTTAAAQLNPMSAAGIAAEYNITPRRVLQYAADGRLPRIGRGRYDMGYFSLVRAGESVSGRRGRGLAAATLAALGWLDAGAREDRALFIELLSRNGISHQAAVDAFAEAKALRRGWSAS